MQEEIQYQCPHYNLFSRIPGLFFFLQSTHMYRLITVNLIKAETSSEGKHECSIQYILIHYIQLRSVRPLYSLKVHLWLFVAPLAPFSFSVVQPLRKETLD